MSDSPPHFSLAMLTLPHEDPLEHAQLWSDWTTAYPDCSPIERVYMEHAFTAMVEKRRIARARATLRRQKVRTAALFFERALEDNVAQCADRFNHHPASALVAMLSSAAGCRWAIQFVERLAKQLQEDGTWYGDYRLGAILIQGTLDPTPPSSDRTDLRTPAAPAVEGRSADGVVVGRLEPREPM